jgi:hypothetical protein
MGAPRTKTRRAHAQGARSGTWLLGVVLASVLATGATAPSGASAKSILTVGQAVAGEPAPGEGFEFAALTVGAAIESAEPRPSEPSLYAEAAFTLKGQAFECSVGGPGVEFRKGALASNKEPVDRLTITNPRLEVEQCKGQSQWIVYSEPGSLVITAGTNGKAGLSGESAEVRMGLQLGSASSFKQCHYQKAALKGTANVSHSSEPPVLRFTFLEKANKLALIKASSASGCPTGLRLGFQVMAKRAEGPRLRGRVE